MSTMLHEARKDGRVLPNASRCLPRWELLAGNNLFPLNEKYLWLRLVLFLGTISIHFQRSIPLNTRECPVDCCAVACSFPANKLEFVTFTKSGQDHRLSSQAQDSFRFAIGWPEWHLSSQTRPRPPRLTASCLPAQTPLSQARSAPLPVVRQYSSSDDCREAAQPGSDLAQRPHGSAKRMN